MEPEEHVALNVDRLAVLQNMESLQRFEEGQPLPVSLVGSSSCGGKEERIVITDESEPLLRYAECRICQEEDDMKKMESPCACSGSLKYAHRTCVQRWCDEKGDITCEICHEPYKPGYTAPARSNSEDAITIDISGGWTITGTSFGLHDPRILSMAAAQRHFLEAEYDEYPATNNSGAVFCRSAALSLIALLLLRHAMSITGVDEEDDDSAYFSLFLLRVAGFLLPCYITAWVISIWQRRWRRQEAVTALAAAELAFFLQSPGQSAPPPIPQFAIVPEMPSTPQEPQLPPPPPTPMT